MFPSLKESIGFACDALPTGVGYTWTLTTRLGQFLGEAERLFGPRDMTWTPLGVEFHGDIPQVWYPGSVKYISIMLTDSCRTDPKRALFQLAHEVIHLLSPTGGRNAPVIEEGLATLFSDSMSQYLGLGYLTGVSDYLLAKTYVLSLLEKDRDAIRKLREAEPAFQKFTPELIQSIIAGVSPGLAANLCVPFQRQG